jgi:SAM-dependent methyltransferase
MQQAIDQQRVKDFAGKLLGTYTGCALTTLVDIGNQTGLFDAAAKNPATSQELAERAGLHERYVREWLGAMTTGGIFTYDPTTRTYTLPAEHAVVLTGDTARNLAPMSQMLNVFGRNLSQLVQCFRDGGGIPYSAFWPAFTEAMGQGWRRIYDEHLLSGFLPAANGLPERLQAGIRVADIGCGAGHAVNIMAREYPNSTFVGYDIDPYAVEKAAAEARDLGLANARFEVCNVTQLPAVPRFDLIVAFDAIHDQVAPATVLRRVHDALAPDGTFLMIDFKFSSNLEENIGNPFAPLYYGISVMHCLTVSLAEGGAGLGTMWGIQVARRMLAEAGFTHVEVVDSPRPQNCIFICRKGEAGTSEENRHKSGFSISSAPGQTR